MSVVGERVRRTDGEAKARGEAIYGVDFLPRGTIYGVLLRSPVPAGRIVGTRCFGGKADARSPSGGDLCRRSGHSGRLGSP